MSSGPNATYDPLFFQLFELPARKGDLRKFQIVEAAIKCIARDGIRNTTYDSVAAELKLSRPHLIYHYPNIESLFEATIRYVAATAQKMTVDKVSRAKGMLAQLEAIVFSAIEWSLKNPDQGRLMLVLYHYCTFDPKYALMNREMKEVGRARMRAVLQPLKKMGMHDSRLDELVSGIQALTIGMLLEMTTEKARPSLVHQETKRCMELILAMLENHSGASRKKLKQL